jgi:iron complex outermembrane receptor protein
MTNPRFSEDTTTMKQRNLVQQAVRGALVAGASAAVVAGPAALAAGSHHKDPKSTKLQKIQVVGSRILRTSIQTAQPVFVLTRQQLNLTGEVSIGNILQSISSAGAAINAQTNNGNDGDTFVDLHNLGSKRVLILVNGHRWIPTAGGSVDLNTIPASIIQRVEILLDGASPIYGSDAITGVINIITVQNFNGAEAHAEYGIYNGDGHWDGKTQEYDLTIGASNSHGGALLSAMYKEQEPIWAANRKISQLPLIGTGLYLGSSGTPGGRFIVWEPHAQTPSGKVNFYPSQFAKDCAASLTPSTPPYSCDLGGPLVGPNVTGTGPNQGPNPWSDADAYNYAPANYLLTPDEQWSIYSQAHYNLTNHVTFDVSGLYNHYFSQSVLAPNPLFLGFFGSDNTANGLAVGISATNPYNPFGADLVPYTSANPKYAEWCKLYGANNGQCSANAAELAFLGRRMIEAGYRVYNYNKDTYDFGMGFKGYFRFLHHDWDWNVHYGYGTRDNHIVSTGLQDTERLQLALGPLSTCQSTPGCVPLDLFGGYTPVNPTITPAMANYIDYTNVSQDRFTQRDYSGNLTGTLANLSYGHFLGPVSVALGYEYLEDNGSYQPDDLVEQGNATTNAARPTRGREASDAQYIELELPLAHGLPFVHRLSVDLANRWTQFTWSGIAGGRTVSGRAHNSSGKVGIKWETTRDLLLRADWSQGFRIPSVSEFFAGQAQSFDPLTDPCVADAKNHVPIPSTCPTSFSQPDTQIPVTVGGNPNLTPEKSISRTVGFVYNPSWLPGFDVEADFWKIELDNAIVSGGVGPQNIMDFCYSNRPLLNFCSLISRSGGAYNTPGAITNVIDLNQNVGSIDTNGWDVQFGYRFPSTPVGDFKLLGDMTFNRDYIVSSPAVNKQGVPTEVSTEYAGSVSQLIPKHKYNFTLQWDYGPWSAAWSMYVIGPMWEVCQNSSAATLPYFGSGDFPTTPNKFQWCSKILATPNSAHGYEGLNELGTTVYNDLQATYAITRWNTDITLGVRNLFDKNPPISMTAFANSYQPYFYRVPGRFIYGRIGVRF